MFLPQCLSITSQYQSYLCNFNLLCKHAGHLIFTWSYNTRSHTTVRNLRCPFIHSFIRSFLSTNLIKLKIEIAFGCWIPSALNECALADLDLHPKLGYGRFCILPTQACTKRVGWEVWKWHITVSYVLKWMYYDNYSMESGKKWDLSQFDILII